MTEVEAPRRIVDAPLVSPSPSAGLLEVFRRRYLLRLLVRREVNARYQASALGFLWSYINPLSQLFIFWFVMGKIMDRGTEMFAVHVFCGLIVVQFFVETFNAGTRSIVRNKALVRKMAVPREMFPVASMMVSLYHIGPQLIVLLIICVSCGWTPDPVALLGFVLALGIICLLGTGLALVFSVANVFMRDVGSFVTILSNFVRFGVPMIYPFSLVEDRFGAAAGYYLFNPVADAVLLVQQAFWVGTTSDPEATQAIHIPDNLYSYSFLALGVGFVMLVIGQLVFRRFENRIPERL
ncbi:ABC transporter permease [Nocardioides sp. cx-173]|uniref:ABC transporter permease n=1 Tax=Nocardioides sp. cx-173 TaxID=2898796 RepID=UPI001E53D9F7|nr:ABC transporter permease [Nocardioides sp. cx-173]MCD4525331.1 ABC transporter permease [Nocardioides sp. cx-173]UGB40872.1 ABC transporter permease [Nocardioides sp. cx-173]